MKIAMTALALSFMIAGTAFADTIKPAQHKNLFAKVDMTTTQSIDAKVDCAKIKPGLIDACGKASSYPENPLSGLNLGF